MRISGPVIQLVSGKYLSLERPEESDFTIEDIAHGLSNCCRFAGHVREFYSVAQHSILVAMFVPEKHRLAGLLHDAAEAFVGDVARPLKELLPDYRAVERRVQSAVLARFGIGAIPDVVKAADLVLLATERRDLMPPGGEWECLRGVSPLPRRIVPLAPAVAKREFLRLFAECSAVGVERVA